MRKTLFSVIFLALFCFIEGLVFACETCSIPRLGREDGVTIKEGRDKRWFVKYVFEQHNWKEKPAAEANNLHEAGHHFHDKTTEEFYHFTLGNHPSDNFTLLLEMPYVVRHSLEIEDMDRLGQKEESDGFGDLSLIGDYRFFKASDMSLSAVTGIKLPSGYTKEKNSAGERFEPELQPGTGSIDYLFGGIYRQEADRLSLVANAIYALKSEGSQHFKFGDFISTSLFVDYLFNPQSKIFKTKIGLDANFQYEQRQYNRGTKVADSGGTTLFLGPSLETKANGNISGFGSFLFPVYQNLGGVHQELDYAVNAGLKVDW